MAPCRIDPVEIRRCDFAVCLETEVPFGFQKINHIVTFLDSRCHVVLCPLADRKTELMVNQPLQTHDRPAEDTLDFLMEFFNQKRIIHPFFRSVPHGENQLPPKKALAAIIQGFHRAVAECNKPGVHSALIALLSLSLQIQRHFCGDNGLDVVGLGEGFQLQIIIDHDENMLQIGTGKGAGFDL